MVQVGRALGRPPARAAGGKMSAPRLEGCVGRATWKGCVGLAVIFPNFQTDRPYPIAAMLLLLSSYRRIESPLLLRARHTMLLFFSLLWRGVVRESRAPRLTRRLAPVASRCPASDRPSGQSTRASKPPPRWTSSDGSACAGSTTPRWCGLRRASSPAGGPRCRCPRCSRGCSCPARRTSPWAAGVRPDHDP